MQNFVEKKYTEVKKNLKQLVFLALFSGLFFQILPGSNIFWWPINTINDLTYTKSIFGQSIYLGSSKYIFDTGPSFSGDGYSYEEFQLSDKQIKSLSNPSKDFFIKYPQERKGTNWKTNRWSKTPMNLDNFQYLQALTRDSMTSVYNLEELLSESGNFYAYKHSSLGMNISFYLLCPAKNLLIFINYNS